MRHQGLPPATPRRRARPPRFDETVTVTVDVDRAELDSEIQRRRPDAPLSASEERMIMWSAAQTLLERRRFCNVSVPSYTDDALPRSP